MSTEILSELEAAVHGRDFAALREMLKDRRPAELASRIEGMAAEEQAACCRARRPRTFSSTCR